MEDSTYKKIDFKSINIGDLIVITPSPQNVNFKNNIIIICYCFSKSNCTYMHITDNIINYYCSNIFIEDLELGWQWDYKLIKIRKK